MTDYVGARRSDALLALVTGTAVPRTGSDSAAPTVASGQAHIVVHVTTAAAALRGGPEIPANTAERLACDGSAQVLLEDTERNRLYLGRSRRLASPAQIAALTLRDEGRCQFPGCTHTRHLHAHHVRHWFHGGRTDIDNLMLTCSFHHTLLHDHDYRVRRDGSRWIILRPDDSPVPATGPPLSGHAESLVEINTRAELRITRDSLTPTWAGERLDLEPVLDRLLPTRPRAAA